MAYVPPNLESTEGKLRRAEFHLKVFNDQVTEFQRLHKHTISVEDDPRTSQYVFKVRGIRQTDETWSYIVGDCLHNLRSALDHLVYQLAVLSKGRELTESEAKGCMFPIYQTWINFNGKRHYIELLRPDEQTRIEELQIFNAQNDTLWMPVPGVLHRMPAGVPTQLFRLQALEAFDKHRLVHATWQTAQWFNAQRPPPPFFGATIPYGKGLEDNAEVGRWHYPPPRPDLPRDMDMNRYFPIGIALGEPPYMCSAVEALTWCRNAVADVIKIFRPCIVGGSTPLPVSAVF